MVTISMMSAKLATLSLLKRKVFRNKDYDITISVHNIDNKFSSHNSNHIIDVVIRPKFGNNSISM